MCIRESCEFYEIGNIESVKHKTYVSCGQTTEKKIVLRYVEEVEKPDVQEIIERKRNSGICRKKTQN